MALLETEDLVKSFGHLVANDGISLGVDEGEIRGIIGPNGSGKSTFFNCLTGFYSVDSGSVRFDGEDITDESPHAIARKGLCRTFQIPRPFEDLTVRENLLAVHSRALRVSKTKDEKATEVMELLDIDHLAAADASGLSGGQQKLLELARILMLDPKCILLDEPTAGVNPALQSRILGYLQEMNERGTTFVVIEHDMSVIEDICDEVTVFHQGNAIVSGSFAEVSGDDAVREAYLSGEGESIEEVLS
jgi:ABC-type branched-subunit amino acid transport system ATPase component